MNNEITKQKSWWQRNRLWIGVFSGILCISTAVFFTTEMDVVATSLVQAYADPLLYENALEKVNADERVKTVLGEIGPIDNLAILEGQVLYSNDNKTVKSTIRITGTKGRANMDITAHRIQDSWDYTQIRVRIKKPSEKAQTIEIVTSE